MKKILAAISSTLLAITLMVSPAAGADTRQFQYSEQDKSTPAGMSSTFDVQSLQLGISTSDEYEIFLEFKAIPDSKTLQAKSALVKIDIDTNLDGKPEYVIASTGAAYASNKTIPRTLKTAAGKVVQKCESEGWITTRYLAWRVPKTCLEGLGGIVAVKASSTSDGKVVDSLPDGSSWFKAKSSYMGAASCSSSSNANKKLTYKFVTYICKESSGKWGWTDYGPIAIKDAKYTTQKAYYACHIVGKTGVSLGDSGKTLVIDGFDAIESKSNVTNSNFECVKKQLSMPKWAATKVEQTRALDGMVEAAWGSVSAFWNYHPDSGLNITFRSK